MCMAQNQVSPVDVSLKDTGKKVYCNLKDKPKKRKPIFLETRSDFLTQDQYFLKELVRTVVRNFL